MAIHYRFATEPSRVEFEASGKLLAADIHAGYRRARSDPDWRPGMRALWRISVHVDMSEIDLAAIRRDILPELPALV